MLPVTPVLIPEPFAEDGSKNVIPAQSPGTTEPNASWNLGFPPITMLNRKAGGKPPLGADFNGVLHALSQHIFFAQSGCVFPWMGADDDFPGLNYLVGAHVLGADMKEYIAVQPSGPDVPASGGGYVGPKDPTTDSDHTWWTPAVTGEDLPEFDGTTIKIINGKYGVPTFTASTASTPGKAGLVPGPGAGENTSYLRGDGTWGPVASSYELCEFYYFRHPTLRPGFQPAQGGVLQNAAEQYPEAWAYLQTAEGQKLCKTEVDWQAMSTATWYTLPDGTQIGWNGIGGVPFYAPDLSTGSLRLPDLRGMYAEASGFDSLDAGGVHGDGMRSMIGELNIATNQNNDAIITPSENGIFVGPGSTLGRVLTSDLQQTRRLRFLSDDLVPVSAVNRPRAWGALACVHLGRPAS